MDKPIVKIATDARQGMTDAVIWVLICGLTLVQPLPCIADHDIF